ncbi:MAG: M20/M25/M40 family metallo-hydrolase [Methylococcales symbiont of Hymedesmia sp. n. MRB-2018]|nr:MAG: M20/M25/M40 family metallo-hydrolase [Methylococcales symbiont of Hymedesmia sp. n. MRB-2018]KAF3984143.1 MAG: M20/M25/M40 family metallo-hydrolase [Methylococcales symbiont of Hymedesmia sp. n. MRB-2018]
MDKIIIKPGVFLAILIFVLSACTQADNNNVIKEQRVLNTQAARYLDDVRYISEMSRVSGSTHHKKIQNMCAERFKDLGFEVEYHNYGTGTNIIGTLAGKGTGTEKVVVSAHYDTVPRCNGADDNASGVAAVLETARLLVTKKHEGTLVLACWDEEERGLIGSQAYVDREKSKATDIKLSVVYEMIGYSNIQPNSQRIPVGFEQLYPQQVKRILSNQNRGDFIALIYDDKAANMLSTVDFSVQQQNLSVLKFEVSSQLKSSVLAVDLRRSDHSAFWDADYPAIMVTDTANFRNQHYHCLHGEDNSSDIDAKFAIKAINTLTKIIAQNLVD